MRSSVLHKWSSRLLKGQQKHFVESSINKIKSIFKKYNQFSHLEEQIPKHDSKKEEEKKHA